MRFLPELAAELRGFMKISREANIAINWILNQLVPPIMRDSKIIFYPLFRFMFGEKANLFWDFHKNVYKITDKEFAELNVNVQSVIIDRPTDLNQACIERIKQEVFGEILEVGCGKGYGVKKKSVTRKNRW